MQKIMIVLLLMQILSGCEPLSTAIHENKIASDEHADKNHSVEAIKWYDSLMLKYIKLSDNELIEAERGDTTVAMEWLLDRVETTDSATYFVFHIGHEVVDSGESNPRFATDGWVYIDTLTRKVYEYDLPNERLVEWRNKY